LPEKNPAFEMKDCWGSVERGAWAVGGWFVVQDQFVEAERRFIRSG